MGLLNSTSLHGNLSQSSSGTNDSAARAAKSTPIRQPFARIPPPQIWKKGSNWGGGHSSPGLSREAAEAEPWSPGEKRGERGARGAGRTKELTAMMSRSHQGRTSPPRKMEPTESMNASIPPSLPPFSCPFPRLFEGWFDPWEGGASFIQGFRRGRGMDPR